MGELPLVFVDPQVDQLIQFTVEIWNFHAEPMTAT